MSNENQLAVLDGKHGFTQDQWRLITDVFMKGATPDEAAVYGEVCRRMGLDPFRRQIHAVKRWDNQQERNVWSYQTGIDGYRAIANRTGQLAGIDDPAFLPADESTRTPIKATVTVWKLVNGQRVGFSASARYDEYVQTFKDKRTGEHRPNSMWAKMPYAMLGKCAEALALRKAFPEELSGIHTDEEMGQAESPEPPKEAPKVGTAPVYGKPRQEPQETKPAPQPAPAKEEAPVLEADVVDAPQQAEEEEPPRMFHLSELIGGGWKQIKVPEGNEESGKTLGKLKVDRIDYHRATFPQEPQCMDDDDVVFSRALTASLIDELKKVHGYDARDEDRPAMIRKLVELRNAKK